MAVPGAMDQGHWPLTPILAACSDPALRRARTTKEIHWMPPFRRLLRWALLAAAVLFVLGLLAVGTLYFVVASKLPDVESLRTVELQEPMYVYSRDGKL